MPLQSLERLRVISWILDIDHGRAPGLEPGGDPKERADILEALMTSARFENAKVNILSGSLRFRRQAAASVVTPDGPDELCAVGLRGLGDIPIGNGPGAEELAHLIAYALECLPDYIARLRKDIQSEA